MKKGQGSVEYLIIIAVALILIGMTIYYLRETAENVPQNIKVNVDPFISPSSTIDTGDVKVEVRIEQVSSGEYKVEYKIWALKSPIKKAQLALVCMNKPENVAGYSVIAHTGPLKPPNYWANFWTPVKDVYFPCYLDVYIWK
ncbi:class III signal peptide-containing protein [Thermococcus zilligii]|uniref:class III signal peptide-containing protein n=1 Tax=Thermococcus zilligii TaxID=54076 RepID=UPI00029B1CC0|nr:class III signal peptide-containing protein [Thermococcus zilligii]